MLALKLVAQDRIVLAERLLDGGAEAGEVALLVAIVQQIADLVGQRGRAAEVDGTLATAVAVAEGVIRPKPSIADRAPRGDDGALAGEVVERQ